MQVGKHLTCMHEHLRLTSQKPHEKPGVAVQAWNLSGAEAERETGESGALDQPALLSQEAQGRGTVRDLKVKEGDGEIPQPGKALAEQASKQARVVT